MTFLILSGSFSYAQDSSASSTDELEFTEIGPEANFSVSDSKTVVADVQKDRPAEMKLAVPEKAESSLSGLFLAGFIGGLAALLTPCIFPMLP